MGLLSRLIELTEQYGSVEATLEALCPGRYKIRNRRTLVDSKDWVCPYCNSPLLKVTGGEKCPVCGEVFYIGDILPEAKES